MLKVADNTGARKLQCIRVLGGYQQRTAGLADVVTCVVKEAVPHGTVKKADIVHAVLVRVHKETRRPDGTYIRFDDNAAVIIDRKSKQQRAKGNTYLWTGCSRTSRKRIYQNCFFGSGSSVIV